MRRFNLASLVQLVERRSPKPDVEGSSPSGRDFKKGNKMANSQKKQNNFKEDFITYFKGVKSEWGKVTWPEKKQIVAETLIVVFVVSAFTIVVYLMDIIFKGLLGLIAK